MKGDHLNLRYHCYGYFPYEHDLALRELSALVGPPSADHFPDRVEITGRWKSQQLWRLTYFSHATNGQGTKETLQHRLEHIHRETSGRRQKRQSTRYSVHGLHEYRGKFNPQIAHALLNVLKVTPKHKVLDPFCGSGTTMVEAAHLGISALGFDLNPLAVFIANTKLRALGSDAAGLRKAFRAIQQRLQRIRMPIPLGEATERIKYLRRWFPAEVLVAIESLKQSVEEEGGHARDIFLVTASNLLRDYSLQEPDDLRIRRRMSPMPTEPFVAAWSKATQDVLVSLQELKPVLRIGQLESAAKVADVRDFFGPACGWEVPPPYDFVITSPPYATALPYIDTQRLSLVWLGLISPLEIKRLEVEVLGSREIIGRKTDLGRALETNAGHIPEQLHRLCLGFRDALGPADGFRRQNVPGLLYRYFAGMRLAFAQLHSAIRSGGRMAWVVGHNRTTLGGQILDIDTPSALATLGQQAGFALEEPIELQTYQRYGLHQKNAIRTEKAVLFRK